MVMLTVCGGCSRHVRVGDARCPFCGVVGRPGDEVANVEVPRTVSRAVLATLGATLALEACHESAGQTVPRSTADAAVVRRTHVEATPRIAAPYGAPPDPGRALLPPAVRDLVWFITMSNTIPFAARANTPLLISASNPGRGVVRPERHRLRLRVNGVLSPAFDLAFQNGTMDPAWEQLGPGQRVSDTRRILLALFPAPGEYLLTLEWDGRRVAGRSMTVTP